MIRQYFILLYLCVQITMLYTAAFTITQAGLYELGEDIIFSPNISNDSIITISANDVMLDLGGHYITQGNFLNNTHGITILPGFSNIFIKNGRIQNVTGKGIIISQACSNITIESVVTFSCDSRAIDCNGNVSPNQINNISVSNCNAINCCIPAIGDFVISLSYCTNCVINDCRINNNGGAHTLTALRVNNTNASVFDSISTSSNVGTITNGIEIVDTVSCVFSSCITQLNNSTTGGCIGVRLAGTTSDNSFIRCGSLYNLAATGNCFGFNLIANTRQNTFQECFSLNNQGSGNNILVAGFYFQGTFVAGSATVINNNFIRCIANYNTASGTASDCIGWLVDIGDRNLLENCSGSYNTSANQVAGIRFNSSVGTNINWQIKDCLFMRNRSTNSGNENNFSYGTRIQVGSNNLFTRNIAFSNGDTAPIAGNQCDGIPGGSVTTPLAPATSNLNGITIPWTNLALAS